ncbi:hypothetical protein HZC34_00100, partial [Candidatus Saganbacteria bacterium]|nr:hypothetical protein [Candidatus Saganbacteria bacterium]
WWGSGWGSWVYFNLDHDQNVRLTMDSQGNDGDRAMQWDVEDDAHTTHTEYFSLSPLQIWMNAGTHRIRAYVASNGIPGRHFTDVYAYFTDRKFNQYSSSSSNFGQTWESASGPTQVDSYATGPTTYPNYTAVTSFSSVEPYARGAITHNIRVNNHDLYYKRGSITNYSVSVFLFFGISWYTVTPIISWSNEIKITNIGDYFTNSNPSICEDASHNAYVAWEGPGPGIPPGIHVPEAFLRDIYFQKIPSNFAPVNGSVTAAAVISNAEPQTVTAQSTTLEAPTLIAPKDKNDPAYSDITTLRPTFQWQHRRSGQSTVDSGQLEYKLQLAKNDSFTIAPQIFSRSAASGSLVDKNDLTLFNYRYAIDEFDPGLDRDHYYWKVTALTTNEAATSETRSFTVQPDLTLTGVTNYPNPFNPNREKTKIRYRLGRDADSVKIRIYDIAGALVTELDGSTNGESSNIWLKYNDVEWNGQNGSGYIVVNGIYPFEVIARLGDRTLTERGKIAVLK